MAKKEKGQGRTVYFKNASLWIKIRQVAEVLMWSDNQLIEDSVKDRISRLRVNVEQTNTGFSASATDYSVFTTAGNLDELLFNMTESFILYFQAQGNERRPSVSEIDFRFI